ncbi:MAG: ABC transporter ATP-binding protein [Acidobacteria bacterium]|nr:ABC transporter ATP-binding protein [Acidobacteriota bacterium]
MDIRFEQVSKKYGSVVAVENLTLHIRAGEFLVLLGPTGCGKTTILRLLAGLETVTSGEIFLGERPITHLKPRQRDFAMVFQSYALYPHMTVAQNLAYPLRVRKTPAAEQAARVKQVAEQLELSDLLQRMPRQLSGGQRQRVALGRAIIRNPNAFLLDEPLSNIDAKLRLQMRMDLKHLQHTLGATTVYVTHDQAEAMTLAHRVAVFRAGVLEQVDEPMTIYHRPANQFVAGFVGSPPMNFLAGAVDASTGAFVCGELRVPLPPPLHEAAQGCAKITLGIRPEHVKLSHQSQPGWQAGRVFVSESTGSETLVSFRCEDQRLTARVAGSERFDFDAVVWFSLDSTQLHLFESATGRALR